MGAEEQTARAIVKANAQATISIFLSARVKKLPFRAGQTFQKGQVIIAFDCARYRAELRAKQAVFSARKQEVTNNRRLLRFGAIGASEVAVSKSRMLEAEALVEMQQALVQQCIVKAPYSGRVVERLINENETPGPNQPLIKIVDVEKTELELIIPSRWLVWLTTGTNFSFRVDETGAVLEAKVSRLGAVVDAVSQTIRITGEFLSDQKNTVLPGMSGTATFTYSGS
ncbi:hypothetical protein MNBD_ALPHA08-1352 [hydrothermal vent metagenome]|uniref:Uncharacterized protein n=1 Tax=hydrothermal vent metagenome TaxID=652676 RepID=A0A3B0S7X3_9ZZZZ